MATISLCLVLAYHGSIIVVVLDIPLRHVFGIHHLDPRVWIGVHQMRHNLGKASKLPVFDLLTLLAEVVFMRFQIFL
jgi:hypothetical protein